MNLNRVYFDNAASTPLLPEAKKAITRILDEGFGNPSSLHREGRTSRTYIEDARKQIANHLNASIGEIFFTSGGTESNNAVIKSAVFDLKVKRIISSPIEHPCVLKTIEALENHVDIVFTRLNPDGSVNLEALEELLKKGPRTLVSLMHINNEIGTINPIEQIGTLCKQYDALFHTDTVQGIGYYHYDLKSLNINYLSASAHKFHGPKGVGFLYVNMDTPIRPLIHGGQQERNMRAGTENVPYITGMAKALEMAYDDLAVRREHIQSLKSMLKSKLAEKLPGVRIVNASDDACHYKIINLAVPLTEKSQLAILNMDIKGFAISGGSACSSGAETDSHVYQYLFPNEDIKMLRVSFSHFNTLEEVEAFVSALQSIL